MGQPLESSWALPAPRSRGSSSLVSYEHGNLPRESAPYWELSTTGACLESEELGPAPFSSLSLTTAPSASSAPFICDLALCTSAHAQNYFPKQLWARGGSSKALGEGNQGPTVVHLIPSEGDTAGGAEEETEVKAQAF